MDNWILLAETYVFFSLIFIVVYYVKLDEYAKEIKDMKKAEYHTTRMMTHIRAKKDTVSEDTIRFLVSEAMDLYILCKKSKNYTLELNDYVIFAREVTDRCASIKHNPESSDEEIKRLIQIIYYFNASY